MIFKIDCDNFVMLYDLVELIDVSCEAGSYELNNDTLKGTVEIKGTYIKKGNTQPNNFSDTVPYTILFNESDIKVISVMCEEFSYEKNNDGINALFKVVVDYEKIDEAKTSIELDSLDLDGVVTGINDEETTEKFNEKLDKFLNDREVVPTTQIEDTESSVTSNTPNTPFYLKLKELKRTTKIIFYKNEKELEKIAKDNNLSISELLNNTQNLGDNRRIILKE